MLLNNGFIDATPFIIVSNLFVIQIMPSFSSKLQRTDQNYYHFYRQHILWLIITTGLMAFFIY